MVCKILDTIWNNLIKIKFVQACKTYWCGWSLKNFVCQLQHLYMKESNNFGHTYLRFLLLELWKIGAKMIFMKDHATHCRERRLHNLRHQLEHVRVEKWVSVSVINLLLVEVRWIRVFQKPPETRLLQIKNIYGELLNYFRNWFDWFGLKS